MDQLDIKYVAGFFDGEGNIGFVMQGDCLTLRVRLGNTNKEILDLLCTQFGGSINKRAHHLNYKDFYNWEMASKCALTFIRLIKPYLIIKKNQADLAEIWELYKPGPENKWDPATAKYLKDFMHKMNRRGREDGL